MAYPVKFLHSGMPGSPVISNGFGDLVSMLDACLVNGFALKTADSISRTGTTATVTVSAGHPYQIDQIVRVSGCDQPAYNGEQRVTSITASTFTYEVEGTPASPATSGSNISLRVAPLGFATAFTGTNKRVYRTANPQGSRPFIRVDGAQLLGYDAGWAKYCRVTVAENMTGIDTFVGAKAPYDPLLPNKNEQKTGADIFGWFRWYSSKSNYYNPDNYGDAGAGPQAWQLIGDDRGFYLFISADPTGSTEMYAVGEFTSFKAGDAFNVVLMAAERYASVTDTAYVQANGLSGGAMYGPHPSGKVLLRDYTQQGNPVRMTYRTLGTQDGGALMVSGLSGGMPYPNGPDFSLVLHPTYLKQENGHLRGMMPGLYAVHNDRPYNSNLTIVDNVVGYPGRKFVMVQTNYESQGNTAVVAFDMTGPWR